jgi:gas vesicle protein
MDDGSGLLASSGSDLPEASTDVAPIDVTTESDDKETKPKDKEPKESKPSAKPDKKDDFMCYCPVECTNILALTWDDLSDDVRDKARDVKDDVKDAGDDVK